MYQILIQLLFMAFVASKPTPNSFEGDWGLYIEEYVEVDKVDENVTIIKDVEDAVTSFYPKTWGWSFAGEGEVAYTAILFQMIFSTNTVKKTCGAVVLTNEILATVCSCVGSLVHHILQRKGAGMFSKAPFADEYDLVTKDIFMATDTLRFKEAADLTYRIFNTPKNQILEQDRCTPAYYDEDKRDLPLYQRANIAVLRFYPRLYGTTEDVVAPWPPYILTDDLTGTSERSKTYQLNTAGAPQFFVASSYKFRLQNLNQTVYNDFRKPIDINNTLLSISVKLVAHTKCNQLLPDFDQIYVRNTLRTIGCYKDTQWLESGGLEGICGGLPGSPMTHQGSLYGFLMSPVTCGLKTDRFATGIAIDMELTDFIDAVAPAVNGFHHWNFVREGGEVVEYDVFFPQQQLLPAVQTRSCSPSPYLTSFFNIVVLSILISINE